MAKYHVNPKTGKPSACGAMNRCPFGGEEVHHDSREAAQKAYEQQQKAQEVPQGVKKSHDPSEGYRQRDLRIVVKATTDPQMLSYAAREGDEGVLRELAANPNASNQDLHTAFGRAKNAKTQELMQSHPNFAKKSYTLKELDEVVSNPSRHRELVGFIEGNASDKLVARISKGAGIDSPLQQVILTSGNKAISHTTKVKALNALAISRPGSLPSNVVNSPNFKVKDFVGDMEERQREWVAVNAKQPATLDALARVAAKDISEGRYPETANDLAVTIYRNEATSDRTKNALMKASPDAASYHKLAEARATRFPEFSDVSYGRPDSHRPLAAGDIERFTFDPAQIKSLGFEENEVKVFMRHMKHQDLYEETYDEATGLFQGKRLFGDPDA